MAKPYYTKEEIQKAKSLIEQLEMYAGENIMALSDETWQTQCNGVGADFFPSDLRDLLTKLYKLPKTTMIHDLMYYLSDGKKRSQVIVDLLFYLNGKIEIKSLWAWYNPYRYWQFAKLRLAYSALKIAAYTAYKEAFNKYNNQ